MIEIRSCSGLLCNLFARKMSEGTVFKLICTESAKERRERIEREIFQEIFKELNRKPRKLRRNRKANF